MKKNHCLSFYNQARKKFQQKTIKNLMLTHFESFFLYLQHFRVKSYFCKNFFAIFQKWTF